MQRTTSIKVDLSRIDLNLNQAQQVIALYVQIGSYTSKALPVPGTRYMQYWYLAMLRAQ